jgi:hypothetical protein
MRYDISEEIPCGSPFFVFFCADGGSGVNKPQTQGLQPYSYLFAVMIMVGRVM